MIRWKTIFNPFSRKILNLKVINPEKIEDFENTDVKIEFNNKKAKLFYIPQNNLTFDSKDLQTPKIQPTNTNKVYEFTIKGKNIFLIDNSESDFKIINIKETAENTVILLDKDVDKIKYYKYSSEFSDKNYGNNITDNFLSLYKNKLLPIIKTKFELENIVNSFEISQNYGVKIEGIELIEYKNENIDKLINYNWFLEDEYIVKGYSKTLLLKFSAKKDDYLTKNVINFLTSEIQLYFREYFCKGEIIE